MAELNINESFDEIEDIIDKMDKEDVSLEDSFKLYEEGMKQLKAVDAKIKSVEEKILALNENGDFEDLGEV